MAIVACILSLFIIWVAHWVYRWRNPWCKGKLPPGSMGFPLIGETLAFFTPNTSFDLFPFVKERANRYGPVFKTSLLCSPVIVSSDPELNNYVFQQEDKLFESCYPDTFYEILGRKNVGSMHGFLYKYLKSLVLRLFGPENLKKTLIHDINITAHLTLDSWSGLPEVEAKDAISTMIFNLTAKWLISYDPAKSPDDMKANFMAFIKGLISIPIAVPGTTYHKCLQGRKNTMRILKTLLTERRNSTEGQNNDFFDYVIEEMKKERSMLTEDIALDLMFVLLFASFETTSLALTLALKLLAEHPQALEELVKEHEALIRNREIPHTGVTWDEYKSMSFTFQVINEVVRLANIAPGIFRKAMKDVMLKEYVIPAGWVVMVCPPAVLLNREIYEDPLSFNPWRWKDKPELNGGSKHFMAFGGGMRFCVGADFTRLQMAIFLHFFVTKFRWRSLRGGNIIRTPGLGFPDGYHIQLMPK